MNKLLLFLIICFSSFVTAQEFTNKLQGCDNSPKHKIKQYCKSKNFNSIYSSKFSEIIEKYGDKVPRGETYLQFTILEDGAMSDLKYFDYDNIEFAKLAFIILSQIETEFKELGLKFFPAIDKDSGNPVKFVHKFPIKFK